jgi:peptidyl-prolyl cis-trans isomerase SurA
MMIQALAVALLLIFFSPIGRAELVDRVVAVVNDDVVLLSELEVAIQPFLEQLSKAGYPPDKDRELRFKVREEILSQLVDRTLTDQEVRRLGLSVEPAEIDGAIEKVKQANFLTDEGLREAMAAQGYTLEEYRENVRQQILRSKLVNREIKARTVITAEDAKAYYERHPEAFGGQGRYHLRNILLARNTPDLAARQALILETLAAGTPFAEVAKRYSQAPQAAEGGDLGQFSLDRLSPQIRSAVEVLSAGKYTPWLETDQGVQLFYLDQILPAHNKSFEEVKPQIEETLYRQFVDEKFRSWLDGLRQRSHIRIIL